MKAPFFGWTAYLECDHPAVLYLGWLMRTLGAELSVPGGDSASIAGLALRIAEQRLPEAPWTLRLHGSGAEYTMRFAGIDQPGLETCDDAAAWGWGGLAAMTGEPEGPPLAPGAPLASMIAALHGLLAIAAARHARLARMSVDVALGDVVASLIEIAGLRYQAQGLLRGRAGDWWGQAGWGVYDCADGRISIALRDLEQLRHAGRVLGMAELEDERFADFKWGMCEALDEVNALLAAGLLSSSARDAVAGLRGGRIAAALVQSPAALLNDPHLHSRSALVEEGGLRLPANPLRALSGTPSSPEPFTGEATQATRPLQGVRVLDISSVWAGPMAARLLADLGARVTKVVPPGRRIGGWSTGHEWDRDFYAILNDRNKRVFHADLGDTAIRERFIELVNHSDVLFENFLPGSLDRLGFGHEALHTLNPRLVIVSMPAFGQSGPDARSTGYGSTLEQAAGIGSLYADAGSVPHRSGINFSDPIAALYAAIGAVLALDGPRNRCLVELSQHEAALTLMLPTLAVFQSSGHTPRAVEATPTSHGWAFADRPGQHGRNVPVRDVPEVIGSPGAPGSRSIRWLRHPDGRDYPLVGLPWSGAFSVAVEPVPAPMPTSIN